MERQVYKLSEVAQILGISRALCYELAGNGRIPVVKLGSKRIMVPKCALQELLENYKNVKGED